jgi:hypothetical protein
MADLLISEKNGEKFTEDERKKLLDDLTRFMWQADESDICNLSIIINNRCTLEKYNNYEYLCQIVNAVRKSMTLNIDIIEEVNEVNNQLQELYQILKTKWNDIDSTKNT